nr:hypothetical protein [Tanacetum cinerariifolium]
DDGENLARGREQKGFYACEVQDDEAGPEQDDVGEPHEPEEERHVDPALVANALLHQ